MVLSNGGGIQVVKHEEKGRRMERMDSRAQKYGKKWVYKKENGIGEVKW